MGRGRVRLMAWRVLLTAVIVRELGTPDQSRA